MAAAQSARMFILPAALLAIAGCIQVPQTTAFDPTLPRTVIDGYAFHTRTFGDAERPPVVVVHGGPGGDLQYLLSLAALKDEYFVVLYDQRGTGLSPREDPEGHSIDRFLADLDAIVLAHAGARPVRMIGHSWGAMLAAAYAVRHRQRVTHLVLAEPGMLDPEGAAAFVSELKRNQSIMQIIGAVPVFISAIFVGSEDGHERSDYAMTHLLGAGSGPPYQCAGDALPPESFRRAGYQSFDRMLAPILEDPGNFQYRLADGLANFSGRTLWLSSECSFIGYEYQERRHRQYFSPNSEHVRLRGTGHNMFTIRPETAVATVREFLRR